LKISRTISFSAQARATFPREAVSAAFVASEHHRCSPQHETLELAARAEAPTPLDDVNAPEDT
jgi:hypothetical protein